MTPGSDSAPHEKRVLFMGSKPIGRRVLRVLRETAKVVGALIVDDRADDRSVLPEFIADAIPTITATAETEEGEERHLETIAVLGDGDELYGITAERLSEITRLQEITEVPNSPDFVEGVVNLRGLIVLIVDLRRHLQLPFEDLGSRGRIVVIEVQSEAGENSIGPIVDSVEEVHIIDQDLVDNETEVVSKIGTDFLRGVVKLEDSLIVLLDIDAIFAQTI